MNRNAFYAELRKRDSGVFGTRLSQAQVEGTENLLNIWEAHFAIYPAEILAYNLATAYHETAHTMQPIKERGPKSYFNKYEPGTKIGKILGNTLKGDGYRYRGEGHVQNTGRANAVKATRRLNEVFNLSLDLVAHPDQRGDPFVSAMSLFLGNLEGWWTTRKLESYIDGIDEEDDEDFRKYVRARAVVNGTDKAELIARHALTFERALKAAGYKSVPLRVEPPKVEQPPAPLPYPPAQAEPQTNWLGIAAFIGVVLFLIAVYFLFVYQF